MNNRLYPILLQKQKEVAELYQFVDRYPEHPLAEIFQEKKLIERKKNFKQALKKDFLAIIAEIKRRSPSRGILAAIENPYELAKKYVAGGANALSILTDNTFFGGSLQDLTQVAESSPAIPLLRKDFIIDKIQIAEAVLAGADAILCIVAMVGDKTAQILNFAKTFAVEVIVEVHDRAELEIALQAGAEIIGVNNRNLKTFTVHPERALELIEEIPSSVIRVAESGITAPRAAQGYHQAGYDAVLIGEALVTAANPENFIHECQHAETLY